VNSAIDERHRVLIILPLGTALLPTWTQSLAVLGLVRLCSRWSWRSSESTVAGYCTMRCDLRSGPACHRAPAHCHRWRSCLSRWRLAGPRDRTTPISGAGSNWSPSDPVDMIVNRQRWLGQPALGAETVVLRTCPVCGPVVSRSRLSIKSSFMCQSAVSMNRVRPLAPPSAQANPA
jgi:hypothetical protein